MMPINSLTVFVFSTALLPILAWVTGELVNEAETEKDNDFLAWCYVAMPVCSFVSLLSGYMLMGPAVQSWLLSKGANTVIAETLPFVALSLATGLLWTMPYSYAQRAGSVEKSKSSRPVQQTATLMEK